MFTKLTSAISSFTSNGPLPSDHHDPARAQTYVKLAEVLEQHRVPVSHTDCLSCDQPCPPGSSDRAGIVINGDADAWEKKSYAEYVLDKYGDLGTLPQGFDTDWESELAGSGKGGRGRIAVISTGQSDWERDHYTDKKLLSYHVNNLLNTLPDVKPPKSDLTYISPSAMSPPGQITKTKVPNPSIYSSSLISQSDDPEDQSVLVFPDWKVVHEVENSVGGAKGLYQGALDGSLGRAGRVAKKDAERQRSWVLPYRAVVLLCSHKRRDKKCHIAAPLLRSALHTVLARYDISVDETGSSLCAMDDLPLEKVQGTEEEREEEVARRLSRIEGVQGGQGGEVGIFNINHLGGHRYAGVMLILFPSGAYLSYGRVTPQEIPRVVEETILQGKVVPGLLRNAVGVQREDGKSFLGW
ncbi:hypothetical protein M231_03447 [Tremella mesenterica]|uniref:Sucrase/ferredoxin-like family protein n=1 Tax=Tremella mesenterica TaxID=5217 RepID=A0A4V1M459_TREME|nr:hypothetical protein M231_03447 [Tremella mesenterica]